MVSIVESSRDTRRTLLYNEEKLEQNKAIFLGAFNYWQEDKALSFDDKLNRLRDLTALNERNWAPDTRPNRFCGKPVLTSNCSASHSTAS